MKLAMARLNEIGNSSILGAQQNSERLSGMFGIRAAQVNPIEAHSIGKLDQAQGGNQAGLMAMITALAAMANNQAHVTPNSVTPGAK